MNDYSNFTSKDGWNTNVDYNAFSGSYFNGDIDIRGGDLVLRNGNILMSSLSTSNYPYTTSLTYPTVATATEVAIPTSFKYSTFTFSLLLKGLRIPMAHFSPSLLKPAISISPAIST